MPTIHFVGFRNPLFHKDPHYDNAVRIFGEPDLIHRHWDARAKFEITPLDVVIFRVGNELSPLTEFTWDDSDENVIMQGDGKDR